MRRILPLIVVLLIFISCAVPAFALGAHSGTSQRYSPLPFQYLYINNVGGPFEYPLSQTRSGSVVQVNYDVTDGSNTNNDFRATVSSQSGYLDGNFYFHGNTYHITFEMRDAIAMINKARILYAVFGGDVIWDIRVYGSYYVPQYGTDKRAQMTTYSFDSKFVEQTDKLFINDYIKAALSGKTKVDLDSQLFKYLCVDINIEVASPSGETHFEVYTPETVMTYTPPDVGKWVKDAYAKIAAPVPDPDIIVPPFSLKDFLLDTVGGFLEFEILPDFSFGKIFLSVICIGLTLWAIKLFS